MGHEQRNTINISCYHLKDSVSVSLHRKFLLRITQWMMLSLDRGGRHEYNEDGKLPDTEEGKKIFNIKNIPISCLTLIFLS